MTLTFSRSEGGVALLQVVLEVAEERERLREAQEYARAAVADHREYGEHPEEVLRRQMAAPDAQHGHLFGTAAWKEARVKFAGLEGLSSIKFYGSGEDAVRAAGGMLRERVHAGASLPLRAVGSRGAGTKEREREGGNGWRRPREAWRDDRGALRPTQSGVGARLRTPRHAAHG
eukprot:6955346-Prymnesium_polylepis.2